MIPDQVTGLLLTPPDQDQLRELLSWYRQMRRGPNPEAAPVIAQAREVYLARAPSGIPAMTAEAGIGTDSSVGIISKADCKLYRIDDKEPNIDVDPLGVTKSVYNPSIVAVPANTLFLAVCTKDGKFVAVQLGGGGSATETAVIGPLSDGATPPKPKLLSYQKYDYTLATDTVDPVVNGKVWARNANQP